MIQILIADDHRLIRETWSLILSRDKRFHVTGNCANSKKLLSPAANSNQTFSCWI